MSTATYAEHTCQTQDTQVHGTPQIRGLVYMTPTDAPLLFIVANHEDQSSHHEPVVTSLSFLLANTTLRCLIELLPPNQPENILSRRSPLSKRTTEASCIPDTIPPSSLTSLLHHLTSTTGAALADTSHISSSTAHITRDASNVASLQARRHGTMR